MGIYKFELCKAPSGETFWYGNTEPDGPAERRQEDGKDAPLMFQTDVFKVGTTIFINEPDE